MQFITLTTDMGLKDYYVGSLKAFIYQQCNNPIHLIDISHEIRPFTVSEAAYQIMQAYSDFPKGSIHILGVEAEPLINNQSNIEFLPGIMVINDHYFISNDNGIFGILSQIDPNYSFYQIDNMLTNPKNFKFAAKNILAATACKIANGEKIEDLATPHDQFNKSYYSIPTIEENVISGSIIYFDYFGNAITNIDKKLFDQIGKNAPFSIRIKNGTKHIIKVISDSYNDVVNGETLAMFNDKDTLEIAINKAANTRNQGAEKLLGLEVDDSIVIVFEPNGSVSTIHELSF